MGTGLFTYIFCEKWPQEQGEMAGVNIPYMDPLGMIYPGSP